MNLKIAKIGILFLLIPLLSFAGTPASRIFTGKVIDIEDSKPIENASIYLKANKKGTTTNAQGEFSIDIHNLQTTENKAIVSCVGYKPLEVSIVENSNKLTIELDKNVQTLSEVEVKRKRYSSKNNPAVDLIKKVIEHKDLNRKESIEYFDNEKYEKVQFALNHITPEFQNKKVFKNFQFVFENIDSLKNNDNKILPVYLKEEMTHYTFLKDPKSSSEESLAHKTVSFKGVDNKGIEGNIKYLYQDIDLYKNNINFLSNQFLSPIANSAPFFYKYFLVDSIMLDKEPCARLYFGSKNKADMLFQGYLYILLDGSYAIKKAEISVNNKINLNWVNDIKIVQDFIKADNGSWMISTDQISINFGIKKEGRGLFGQKIVSYQNYNFDPAKAKVINESSSKNNTAKQDDYLEKHRHLALTSSESNTYSVMDSVQKIPLFKAAMNVATFLFSGYHDFGKFEIGPISTFYMYNPVEGNRLRFGGRTTDSFSKKLNLESYLAYGFKDERFKYYVGGAWSFTDHNVNTFPVKSLKASYQNETQLPGQQMQFLMEDNFLLSIKRGVNDKLFYNKTFKLEHQNEFENHFSYTMGYKFTQMTPGGNLRFNYTDYNALSNDVDHLNVSELYLNLRYAPHESFYQGKTFRVPYYNRFPILELRYNAGLKSLGNDYNYQILRFNLRKRFYLSFLGYSDVVWEVGKIWGNVPYPLLNIPQANQTYSYQIESFNMMNFLEFVTDQYSSILIDHNFNGLIFNKLPIIRKLNLREVMSCKVLYGNLSSANNPDVSSDLFKFPVNQNGTASTYALGNTPYIEGSVGVGNIFKFFRVDLVRRFTYLDNPNVSKYGIRMRFRLDF